MAFKTRKIARPTIVAVAGQRASTRLLNNMQGFAVQLTLRGTLTIAGGAATAIRNRGSLWAAIDEVGILENGKATINLDGPPLRALSEQAAPSALSAVRLTSTAAAAYNLKETVRLYFAHPYALEPRETAYVERNVQQTLEAFIKLAASGGADRLCQVGGAVTATLANVTATVTHIAEPMSEIMPYLVPRVYQGIENVTGTTAALPHYIKTPNIIRALVVSPVDTVVGEVSDIINSLSLRGDSIEWVDQVDWDDLILGQEFDFGGDSTFSVGGVHLGFNFQTFGRLAQCMNPAQDTNLRFEFNCQPSAVGTGTSQIKVTRIELEQIPGLTRPLTIPV